jgi:hypothetical protein
MTETDSALNLDFGSLEIICYLACLREAPPPEALRRAGASAKAGAWDLVLIISLCSMRHALCYLLIYRFTASNPLQRWASSWGSMV